MFIEKDYKDKIKLYLKEKGHNTKDCKIFITEPFYTKNGIGFYSDELSNRSDKKGFRHFKQDVYMIIKDKKGKVHDEYKNLYHFKKDSAISDEVTQVINAGGHEKVIVPLDELDPFILFDYTTIYRVHIADILHIPIMVDKEKEQNQKALNGLSDVGNYEGKSGKKNFPKKPKNPRLPDMFDEKVNKTEIGKGTKEEPASFLDDFDVKSDEDKKSNGYK